MDKQEDVYQMAPPAGNGIVLVMANFTGELVGYKLDIKLIQDFFQKKLNYPTQNILVFENMCREEFMGKLTEVQTRLNDQKDIDRMFMFILSHGNIKGVLMCKQGSNSEQEGVDGNPVSEAEIIQVFLHDKLKNLKGKPKMFFIQTCRGPGKLQAADIPTRQNKEVAEEDMITIGADTLICHSTLTKYASWVNSKEGSYYIKALIEEFTKHYQDKEMTEMLRELNREIAKKMIGKESRQMCEYTSRLTSKVFLYQDI